MTNPLFAGHRPTRPVSTPPKMVGILWTVVSPHSQITVTCRVVEQPHGLELRIERALELHLSEVHRDRARLLARSRTLQTTLIEKGWVAQ